MCRHLGKAFVSAFWVAVLATVICSCNEPASAPPPPAPVAQPPAQPTPPPAPVAPVQPQAVAAPVPAAPPATPLVPVGEPTDDDASTPKKGGGKKGIDAPIPGQKTEGDELVGDYECKLDAKQLQIGPFKAPPFGCKIFKAGDGTLKVASTAQGAGSMKGTIKDSTATGFFIVGNYTVAGNKMAIKSRMKMRGPGKYMGKGRGRFNDDKSNQISYTLTMTRR